MEGLVCVFVLGTALALKTSIKRLLASLSVHYDTESCNHEQCLAVRSVSPDKENPTVKS